jgi:hypothetical protein
MTNGKILIYDDESAIGKGYADRLERSIDIKRYFKDIECIDNSTFLKEMRELRARQIALRKGETRENEEIFTDSASIMIVDYDLVNAPEYASFLTGEIVSYYVRCFSQCRYIIGINQFGTNNFDLSLKRHPDSFADLNIGNEQLDNPGLWGGKTKGFKPWYWPNIPKVLDSIDQKIDDIERNLKVPICEFFGMSPDIISTLPKIVSEYLGDIPENVTFENFLNGNTLKPRDKQNVDINDPETKLLIISRISKWLEEVILPGQNILIDAPHLIDMYPSLLLGDHKDVETWDNTARLDIPEEELGLNFKAIEKFRMKNNHWLSRPAWFLNKLIDNQEIHEVREPWSREDLDLEFCEDSSTFLKSSDCKEFLIEIDTPYARRYVREFTGVIYVPRVRFLL